MTKAEILERIEHLKQTKPDGWKGDVREWLRELARMEDPFREHVYCGSEFKGRRARPPNRSSYPLGLH
jgi:hypothetical protein